MEPEEILADPDDERIDYLTKGGDILSSYGWFIFAGFVLIGIFWTRIQRYLDKLYNNYEARKYDAKYHKNPDLALERLEALQIARQRMQKELDRKAQEHKERTQERELQKAKEKLSKLEGIDNGHRLGDSPGSSSKEDYNPLMGDTARGYRPPKRSGCSGGGCGR